MATFVMTDATVIVNGVTLSDHAYNVTATDGRKEVDATTYGATSEITKKGLGTAQIDIDFYQDFAGGSVYATLQPLIASTSTISIELRPTSAARSATNPAILLTQALMFTFQPLAGKIGDMAAFTATFKNAGSAGMTYATS